MPEGDVYFIDNRRVRPETLEVSLRVSGKDPELWHPDTGATEPAPFTIANNRTTIPISLEPWGTTFVVLRKPTTATSRKQPQMRDQSVATIEGAWDVTFQENRGAPARLSLDKLTDWSTNSNEGVKYFSGTATYKKTLQADATWFQPTAKLYLDLGNVKNIAEVSVNGQSLGILWKTPFRIDITKAAKPGSNTLEVKVTNLWVNRMIGDRQPNAKKQFTFTNPAFYKADSPLLPSGLIGPVQVFRSQAVE